MDNPLSGTDIENYLGGKCRVISYDQIKEFSSIDDLLGNHGRCVILYVWAKNPDAFGHWQCVFRNKNGNVEVFDSYGSWIDSFLNKIDKNFRIKTGQNYKFLTKLLYDSNYNVEYNDKVLQNKNSNTCGKWCVLRMLCNHLDIDEFNSNFTKNTKKNDLIILELFSQ